MPGKTMLTEDYIIRMISTVLTALIRIAGLKNAGQYQEAQQLINQNLEELFGMRVDLLKRLDDETLIASLSLQDKPEPRRLAAAGRLFQEEGDILTAQADPQAAFWSYLRALNLSLEASTSGLAGEKDLVTTLNQLLEKLKGYNLPPDTQYALFCHYEEISSYRQADAVLREMEAFPQDRDAILAERAAFYNRLLQKNDQDLQDGGLSRLQVVEALNTIILHKPNGS